MKPILWETIPHFCHTLNCYFGFRGNNLRQNARSDCGDISCVHTHSDFDMCFCKSKSTSSPQPSFPCSLFKQRIPVWKTDMRSALFSQNEGGAASSSLRYSIGGNEKQKHTHTHTEWKRPARHAILRNSGVHLHAHSSRHVDV